MKSLSILFVIVTLSSCITIETTSSGFKDEIYYSADTYAEVAVEEEMTRQQAEQAIEEESYETEEDQEYTDEYSSDDYYDYYYSARLRRFHGPSFGFNYYNNYFTNSFWYSSNPYHCGVSIYYGYNFWNPYYYDPFYAFYYPQFSPYYQAYHYPYNHYHHHDHLLASHYYPTYFNSYDNNSIYYGARVDNKNKTPESFARLYNENVKNKYPNVNSTTQKSPQKTPSYFNKQPSVNTNSRPASSGKHNSSLGNKTNSPIYSKPNATESINRERQPNRPAAKSPSYSNPKPNYNKQPNYSKPSYNKPKPSYSTPKPNRNRTPSMNKSQSSPSYNKSYSSPSRSYSPRGGSSKRPR